MKLSGVAAAAAMTITLAAEAPPTATALLDGAKAEAARNHRAIFVICHASW